MSQAVAVSRPARSSVAFGVLGSISLCHMLNDTMQSLLLAIYPLLKQGFALNFAQIGLITLTYQTTASLLQPVIGWLTDRRPQPYALPFAMVCSLGGLLVLSAAGTYPLLLAGAALLGTGSSIFHPESSRIARTASAGRLGLGQSLFQVGGNFGTALGPLLAAFIVLPNGRGSLSWFAAAALCGAGILTGVARWYSPHARARAAARRPAGPGGISRRRAGWALAILIVLIFSKYFYLASINSYYLFYLIHHFHLRMEEAQLYLFVFLAAAAAGVVIGGPVGDRFGRKYVIWGSIVGVLPFTLALPYAGLAWTVALTVAIGLILSSAFYAIVVYATELMPARVGLMSGLFFGLAFGVAGVGAAALGALADLTSIDTVYRVCAFLPALGLLAVFLPNLDRRQSAA